MLCTLTDGKSPRSTGYPFFSSLFSITREITAPIHKRMHHTLGRVVSSGLTELTRENLVISACS